MNEDIEIFDNSDSSDFVSDDAENIVSDTETISEEIVQAAENDTIEVVSVQPVNAYGLTQAHMHFFALGFFVLLMFVYFVCQRGSYNGRNT